MIRKVFLGTAAAVMIAAMAVPVAPATAADGAGQIEYRQKVMKAVGGHMGAMAAIVKGKGGDAKDLFGHAHAMAELAKISANIFPEGSGPEAGKTGALANIWTDRDGFAKVAKAFVAESQALAEVAKGGDLRALGKQMGKLGKGACKACHDDYRAKKK